MHLILYCCALLFISLVEGSAWQNYVDSNLVGSGSVSDGGIINFNGILRAKSSHFHYNEPTDGLKLNNFFQNSSAALTQGLDIGGIHYLTIKADDGFIHGKKGASGIVCVKTGQSIVIGEYRPPNKPEDAVLGVEKLADYMIATGY